MLSKCAGPKERMEVLMTMLGGKLQGLMGEMNKLVEIVVDGHEDLNDRIEEANKNLEHMNNTDWDGLKKQ